MDFIELDGVDFIELDDVDFLELDDVVFLELDEVDFLELDDVGFIDEAVLTTDDDFVDCLVWRSISTRMDLIDMVHGGYHRCTYTCRSLQRDSAVVNVRVNIRYSAARGERQCQNKER